VALDYALSFPESLRSLVIANSIGGMHDEEYLALQRRLRPEEFNALPAELRELGPSYRATNPEGTKRWMELERLSRERNATPPRFRNRLTFALLETLKVPTLFITGDADTYMPAPVLALFTSRVCDSKSAVIPGAGHSAYWEQPELFNQA